MPGPAALRAGVAYEQKLDGHRVLVFTAAGPASAVLVQTRRGSLVQDRFPDLVAAAAEQLSRGLVLDGELLVWDPEAAGCRSRRCSAGPLPVAAAPRPWRSGGRPTS
ncbi:ATP-dependent DNA ligase [Streptomyces xanthophaeus]